MKQLEEAEYTKQGRPTLTESGLRPKHRAFIRNLMSGQGIDKSGLAAGFGRRTGYDLMKNPAIRSELARQLEQVGVTDTYIAKKVKQGLNAKTVPQKENGKRYDDQFVRKQWADIAIKVKGGYAPEKIETEHKIVQIVIDSNMLNALKDSRALSEKEIKKIEHMPVDLDNDNNEVIDAEIEVTDNYTGNGGRAQEEESGRSVSESECAFQEKPVNVGGNGNGKEEKDTGEESSEQGTDASARGVEATEEGGQVESHD